MLTSVNKEARQSRQKEKRESTQPHDEMHTKAPFFFHGQHIDTFHDQCEIRKKQDILTEKRENGMALEKWNFLPESDDVDA